MADALEFTDGARLATWLKDKPADWAQAIAVRSALRVFPVVVSIADASDGQIPSYKKQDLILRVWRAMFISWTVLRYPVHDMGAAVATACIAVRGTSDMEASAVAYAAAAVEHAAKVSGDTDVDAATAAAYAATFAANAVESAGYAKDITNIWAAVHADMQFLANSGDPKEAVLQLFLMPVWIQPDVGSGMYQAFSPELTKRAFDQFANLDWVRNSPWKMMIDWCKTALPYYANARPRSLFGEKADIEITMQPDEFWERKPQIVLKAISEIVGRHSDDKPSIVPLSEFIVLTLEATKEPFSLTNIYELVESAGYTSVRDSIRGRVNELTYDGQIQRVGRGLYASNNWIAPSVDQPPTPEPGPGPHYGVVGGRLAALASPPSDDETTAHERLIVRLKRDLGVLNELAKPIGNSHPHLVGAIAEYGELLSASIEEIDVTGLWSVGSSLAGYAQAFRDQNIARTLSEPLEPQLDGLLQSVVRQHGALILGYEEGRDLVNRADEFALDRNRLAEIEQPGNALLDELSENADLVDDATRALHTPVRDYLHDVGWMANRAGYSGYLIIRNSVRAVIHLTIGKEPTVAVIVGALAGGSVLAGDPSMEFLRAALPFLRDNATQLAAFFHHSPEMKAYVEWALKIIDEVEDAGRHDPDG